MSCHAFETNNLYRICVLEKLDRMAARPLCLAVALLSTKAVRTKAPGPSVTVY